MARLPRHKSKFSTAYHLINRAGGPQDYYPFKDPVVARKFISLFEFYLRLYFCRMSSFDLMNNHFHATVHFEEYREVEREELVRRAQWRFGRRWKYKTRNWDDEEWERFNRKLFDVSFFMAHVEGQFSTWFNRRTGRRGHFWADRFKNPEMLDMEAIQRTIFYIELNPVRPGLVQRPEHWKRSSAYWRVAGKKSDLLIPLEELFPAEMGMDSYSIYRARLYYYGAEATEEDHQVIPDWIIRKEERNGFARPGMFRSRLRVFTDGVAIGSRDKVAEVLEQYREKGIYKRRRNPIEQLGGLIYSLREQRSHAFSPG